MKPDPAAFKRRLSIAAKCAVVASSLLLLGAYVNYRSTGSWLPVTHEIPEPVPAAAVNNEATNPELIPLPASDPPERVFMPGSKSGPAFPVPAEAHPSR